MSLYLFLKRGIKGACHRLAKLDMLAMDKTGTLTQGHFRVTGTYGLRDPAKPFARFSVGNFVFKYFLNFDYFTNALMNYKPNPANKQFTHFTEMVTVFFLLQKIGMFHFLSHFFIHKYPWI